MELQDIFRALPSLETDRLMLRPLTIEDAPAVFAYARDPEVARYTGWDAARSVEDSQAFVDSVLQRYQEGKPACWAVVHLAELRLIGTCGFSAYSPMSGSGFLAYALAREYWGQGLATEAARKAVEFGFADMRLARVQAMCIAENVGSWRVMEKVGLRAEGVLRGLPVKGQPYDLKVYSLLRSEWTSRVLSAES